MTEKLKDTLADVFTENGHLWSDIGTLRAEIARLRVAEMIIQCAKILVQDDRFDRPLECYGTRRKLVDVLAAYDVKGGVPHVNTALAVLKRHYPMVAGHVTALQQAGETVAAKAWAEVARDMYEALKGGGE